jgi:hypothetical protein
MKKSAVLSASSAIVLAAGLSAPSQAGALPIAAISADEVKAYEAALADGSKVALQAFLTQFPASAYAEDVFGRMVQQINHESQGFESSGNPKAAGGPANPGRGHYP